MTQKPGSARPKKDDHDHPSIGDDKRSGDRVTFLAFAKACKWEHDLRTFKEACIEVLESKFGDLLPDDPRLISPALWVMAAEQVAVRKKGVTNRAKNRLGAKIRAEESESLVRLGRTSSKPVCNPYRLNDWVTPRRWASTRYTQWTKSVIRLKGLDVVVYGDKTLAAHDLRLATEAEKEAYFASLKGRKKR